MDKNQAMALLKLIADLYQVVNAPTPAEPEPEPEPSPNGVAAEKLIVR